MGTDVACPHCHRPVGQDAALCACGAKTSIIRSGDAVVQIVAHRPVRAAFVVKDGQTVRVNNG